MPLREPAFAKVNLALLVTGRRPDGYHLLDSLVVFADVGEELRAQPAPETRLEIRGPMAAAVDCAPEANLVLRAARLLAGIAPRVTPPPGARLILEKTMPVAAGLGGGSADAAATLRLLDRLWELDLGTAALAEQGAALGADVPMCVASRTCRVRGIGEVLDPVDLGCDLHLVLVNPGLPLSTPSVFRANSRFSPDGLPPLVEMSDAGAVADWLARSGNDLEDAAKSLCPPVGVCLDALAAEPGCLMARMTGSGATSFGLFETKAEAGAAATRIAGKRADWWCRAATAPKSVD